MVQQQQQQPQGLIAACEHELQCPETVERALLGVKW